MGGRRDLPVLVSLIGAIFLFALVKFNASAAPFEDAAILMRYADHLARGYGIVWNIGEAPIDGATDFLFMVVAAILVRLGATLEVATRGLGFVSHALTVLLVYTSLRRLHNAPVIVAAISALFLAIGPGLAYVSAYFGTPFFALAASLTWYVAVLMIRSGETQRRAILFAALSLFTALIRPDGVLLTGFMLVAIIVARGPRSARRAIAYFTALFVSIGGLYFLWRWNYFGYPLPNPFYRKGGVFSTLNLQRSLTDTIKVCGPILAVFLLGFVNSRTRRQAAAYMLPVLCFAGSFVILSDELNFASRYQYVLLPMVLMTWWPMIAWLITTARRERWSAMRPLPKAATLVGTSMLVFGFLLYGFRLGLASYPHDGRYDMALMLSEYQTENLTLATSEAGLLPLYSRWRTIDLWGLNDPWITHNGGLTEQYLDSVKPDLIMFHAYFTPMVPPIEPPTEWGTMTMIANQYAVGHNYVLAAAFVGNVPSESHYYYVRPDSKLRGELVQRIRSFDYAWWGTGTSARNEASTSP
ncbi:MAG: hypothetical protein HZB53_08770 [Chloroflexi bacterium]|nr:hypothetical protein [Chloroflexota bacterium]